MKIQDIRYIPRLSNFQLIAGETGLSREIRNVVIFEYENAKDDQTDYYYHDFIITSLIFAKDNPALMEPMLKKMMELGASGIAVKRAYYEELPSGILAFADTCGIPLFVFDDTYIEDVIVSVASYMQEEKKYSLYQQEIHELITENRSNYDVEKYCRSMNGSYLGCMTAMYLECQNPLSSSPIDQILHTLSMRSYVSFKKDFQFYQYQDGLFILHNGTHLISEKEITTVFHELIEKLGHSLSEFTAGFSSCIQGRTSFDFCFRESYAAFSHAKKQHLTLSHFDAIGNERILFPLLQHKDCQKEYQRLSHLLSVSDGESCMELTATIQAYCACDFQINRTASQLCQHPNTIRYRLKRAMEILGCASQKDFYLTCILLEAFRKQNS